MKVYNKQSDMTLTSQLKSALKKLRKERNFDAMAYIEQKANLLNIYLSKCNLKACVVAVSGGIDSAVVLGLVAHAKCKPNSPLQKIVPLLLPVLGSVGVTNQSEATARGAELAKFVGLEPVIVDLTIVNNAIRGSLEPKLNIVGQPWAIGQLGPYSRTPVIYYTTSLLSQEGFGAVVCGTTNRDEGAYLGYVGKASDALVDLQLISDIHKSEVYSVARALKLPQSVIDVVPTGDMYDNRTDEMVFGAPYDFVELYHFYLNWSADKQTQFVNALNAQSKAQFDLYQTNLENLHRYNKHKYISKSPAIHLDLWDSSVKGGWDNYYLVAKNFLEK